MVMEWRETGGPAVKPPDKTGFGSMLVREIIERRGGTIACDWQPQGLTANITLPLGSIAS